MHSPTSFLGQPELSDHMHGAKAGMRIILKWEVYYNANIWTRFF